MRIRINLMRIWILHVTLMRIRILPFNFMWIRIRNLPLTFSPDFDHLLLQNDPLRLPSVRFDTDPVPSYADPDLDPAFQNDADLDP
jgi:hypothetical protein